jgi:hypothetical protein
MRQLGNFAQRHMAFRDWIGYLCAYSGDSVVKNIHKGKVYLKMIYDKLWLCVNKEFHILSAPPF